MRKSPGFIIFALLWGTAVADMHGAVAAQVRAAVQAFNAAYANDEVEAYFDHYADDALVFFYGARQDLPAYHDEWAEIIEAGGGVEKNALSDLRIQVMPGGDVAVATYFVDYGMREPGGDVTESKAFETEVWQKIDGEWKIVNLHYSEIAPEG